MSLDLVIELSRYSLSGFFYTLKEDWILNIFLFLSFLVISIGYIYTLNKRKALSYGLVLALFLTLLSTGLYYVEQVSNWEENIFIPYLKTLEENKVKPSNIMYKNGVYSVGFEFDGSVYSINEVDVKYDVEKYENSYIEYKKIPKDINNEYTNNRPYSIMLHTKKLSVNILNKKIY